MHRARPWLCLHANFDGSYSGYTTGLTAYVDSVNDALEVAGLPRSYTRKQEMNSIRVTFIKA